MILSPFFSSNLASRSGLSAEDASLTIITLISFWGYFLLSPSIRTSISRLFSTLCCSFLALYEYGLQKFLHKMTPTILPSDCSNSRSAVPEMPVTSISPWHSGISKDTIVFTDILANDGIGKFFKNRSNSAISCAITLLRCQQRANQSS